MEYRVSKSNISSRRRSNKKKRGKRKTEAGSQTWQSRKKNKKATEPAFTVHSHLFHRRHVLISCQTCIQKEKNAHLLHPAAIREFAFRPGKKLVPVIRTPRIICVSYVIEKKEETWKKGISRV